MGWPNYPMSQMRMTRGKAIDMDHLDIRTKSIDLAADLAKHGAIQGSEIIECASHIELYILNGKETPKNTEIRQSITVGLDFDTEAACRSLENAAKALRDAGAARP